MAYETRAYILTIVTGVSEKPADASAMRWDFLGPLRFALQQLM